MSDVAMLNEAGRLIAEVEARPRRFRRYSDYRNCGVRWLVHIPTHWKVRRLKFVADIQNSNVDKKTEAEEVPVRLCNYVDVYHRDYITSNIDFMRASASKDEIRKFSLRRGDVLITKDSEAWNDIAVPAYVDEDFDGVLCGYHLAQVRPRPDFADGEFLHRAFVAHPVRDQFRVRANGITRYGLSADAIASAVFPIPPLDEQKTIAAFLRRETAKIDSLVAKKQWLIELLGENRTALISHAVTKGLNPDAPTKPSGIDWLGDVPAHWEISRLKYSVSKIGSGKTPKGGSQVYVTAGVMLLRSQNIYDDGLRLGDVVFITEATDDEMSGTRVAPGDVLLNITGASIGRCGLVPQEFSSANVNQHVCIIRPRTMRSAFVHAVLCSKGIKDWISAEENGTSREGLNFRQVGNIALPIPPCEEQGHIMQALGEKTAQIDGLVACVQSVIDRLVEYRSALISAAVTGQIDVRKEVSDAG